MMEVIVETDLERDPALREHLEAARRLTKLRKHFSDSGGYVLGTSVEPSLPHISDHKRKQHADDDYVTTQQEALSRRNVRATKVGNTQTVAVDNITLKRGDTLPEKLLSGNINTSGCVRSSVGCEERSFPYPPTRKILATSVRRQPAHLRRRSMAERTNVSTRSEHSDPMMFPGLYAPSGFDMMSILIRVVNRPNPRISIGNVDSSCALVLCSLPTLSCPNDTPIVYCNEAFTAMTGHELSEVIGRNCRFLQSPDGIVQSGTVRQHVDNNGLREMKQKLKRGEETQTILTNFRKDGTRFVNLLTTVEIEWGGDKGRFVVGFQAVAR